VATELDSGSAALALVLALVALVVVLSIDDERSASFCSHVSHELQPAHDTAAVHSLPVSG
jgi:hypothetical protein